MIINVEINFNLSYNICLCSGSSVEESTTSIPSPRPREPSLVLISVPPTHVSPSWKEALPKSSKMLKESEPHLQLSPSPRKEKRLLEQQLRDKPLPTPKTLFSLPRDSLVENSMIHQSKTTERTCLTRSSSTQVATPGSKSKENLTLLLKLEPSS